MNYLEKNIYVSRRKFLIGLAGMSAFPFLEINAAERKSPKYKRLMVIATPFGFHADYWVPKAEGIHYSCKYSPLYGKIKNDISVLSNLTHGGSGGHISTSAFLSGIYQKDAWMHKNKNETVDSFIGRHVRSGSRYPSLHLGTLGAGERVSWSKEGTMVPEITDPLTAYNLLFKPESSESIQAKRVSLEEQTLQMEFMSGGFSSFKSRLSKRDQGKLEEYQSGIVNLGETIKQSEKWIDTAKSEPPAEKPLEGKALKNAAKFASLNPSTIAFQSQLDNAYWALFKGETRVVTLSTSRSMPVKEFGSSNYHSATHHGMRPDRIKVLENIDRMVIAKATGFIERLKNTPDPEGTGNMLDNTIVLMGSGMASGNSHSTRNLPVLLAGGGFKHGQHLKVKRKPNGVGDFAYGGDLLLTIIQQFGLPVNSFNNSTSGIIGVI